MHACIPDLPNLLYAACTCYNVFRHLKILCSTNEPLEAFNTRICMLARHSGILIRQ